MRRPFPIVVALAALTAVGFSGPASAISNNLNVWSTTSDALKKLQTQTKQNPPAAQTKQNSPTNQTNQSSSATQPMVNPTAKLPQPLPQPIVQSKSSTNPPPSKPTTTAELKTDIARQNQDIRKYEDQIARLQQAKQTDPARLASFGTFGRTTCDSNGNCLRSYKSQSFGNAWVRIEVRVDAKGIPLPGEFDKMLKAQMTAIDKAIGYNTQLIADAQKQIGADYDALPGHGFPGDGGVGAGSNKGSTALHQD